MAQTGYTPIQLYRTATASAAPTAGNLADGELAINTLDGKLFYKDSSGVVQTIATKGAGTIGGSNTYVQYNNNGALGGSSSFVFDGTNVGIGTSSPTQKLDVYAASGVLGLTVRVAGSTGSDQAFVIAQAGSNTAYMRQDGNGGSFLVSPNNWSIFTNSSERMRINSSGNVGIGITAPANLLDIQNNLTSQIRVGYVAGSATAYYDFGRDSADGLFGFNGAQTSFVGYKWKIQGTEVMRIDTSGNLLVGASAAPTTFRVYAERSGLQYGLRHPSATAGQYFFMQTDSSNTFYVQSQAGNGVYLTNTGTSWNAVSDERAKDIIEPITDATEKVLFLRAIIGSYKNDDTKKRRSFLIAQDVKAVLPEAVDDTNPDNLGLAYADVIPLLVAAIQELSAKVTALESK